MAWNDTNGTYMYHGKAVVIPLAILMVLFILFAIVGNVMVVLTIVRHKGMRTRTNMFIINLAVADILVAVLDMPFSLITILSGDWIFGTVMCRLNGFTMALFLICSIHTLMYIAIHKYMSITRPFSRAMTPRRIKMMIAAAWVWATICAIAPLLGWNRIEHKLGASQCGPAVPEDTSGKTHSLFITTSNYMIPLSVMSFCYFRIFKEIHVHMDRIRETSSINLENSVAQQKKVSVTLLLVLACFLICWTPFVGYSTALSFMKDKSKMPKVINPLAYWCGYLNSACNPVIYAFRSPSFRKGYKEIVFGKSSAIHSGAGNSMSFRSKSARGSVKSTEANIRTNSQKASNVPTARPERPKRMLSQTSWISLPIIPFLIRSASSGKPVQQKNDDLENSNNSETIDYDSYCCFHYRRKVCNRRSVNSNVITPDHRKESFAILNRDSDRLGDVLEEHDHSAVTAPDNSPNAPIEEETRGCNVVDDQDSPLKDENGVSENYAPENASTDEQLFRRQSETVTVECHEKSEQI